MLKKISAICILFALLPLEIYANGLFSPISGAFSIRSASTGKCLSFGTTQNTGLQQVNCNVNDSSQFWQLIQANDKAEYLLISNQAPARCLDTSTDTPVLTTCNYDAPSQYWNLHFPGNNTDENLSVWKFSLQSERSKKCLATQTVKQIDTIPKIVMVACDNGINQQFTLPQKIK